MNKDVILTYNFRKKSFSIKHLNVQRSAVFLQVELVIIFCSALKSCMCKVTKKKFAR